MKTILTKWRNFILKENWIRIKEEPETRDSDIGGRTCVYKGQKGTCMKFLQKKNGKKIVVTMFEPDPNQIRPAKQESYLKPENIKKVFKELTDLPPYTDAYAEKKLEELKTKCPIDPRTFYIHDHIYDALEDAFYEQLESGKEDREDMETFKQNFLKKYNIKTPYINYFLNNTVLCTMLFTGEDIRPKGL